MRGFHWAPTLFVMYVFVSLDAARLSTARGYNVVVKESCQAYQIHRAFRKPVEDNEVGFEEFR